MAHGTDLDALPLEARRIGRACSGFSAWSRHPGVAAASWRGRRTSVCQVPPGPTRWHPEALDYAEKPLFGPQRFDRFGSGHPSGRVDGDDIAGYQDDQDREDDHQCR